MATRFRTLMREGKIFKVVDKNKSKKLGDDETVAASSKSREADEDATPKPDADGRYQTDVWSDLLDSVRRKQERIRLKLEEDLANGSATADVDDSNANAKEPRQVQEITLDYDIELSRGAFNLKPVDQSKEIPLERVPADESLSAPGPNMSFENFRKALAPHMFDENGHPVSTERQQSFGEMKRQGRHLERGRFQEEDRDRTPRASDRVLLPIREETSRLPEIVPAPLTIPNLKREFLQSNKHKDSSESLRSSTSTITPLSPVFTNQRFSGRTSGQTDVSTDSGEQSHTADAERLPVVRFEKPSLDHGKEMDRMRGGEIMPAQTDNFQKTYKKYGDEDNLTLKNLKGNRLDTHHQAHVLRLESGSSSKNSEVESKLSQRAADNAITTSGFVSNSRRDRDRHNRGNVVSNERGPRLSKKESWMNPVHDTLASVQNHAVALKGSCNDLKSTAKLTTGLKQPVKSILKRDGKVSPSPLTSTDAAYPLSPITRPTHVPATHITKITSAPQLKTPSPQSSDTIKTSPNLSLYPIPIKSNKGLPGSGVVPAPQSSQGNTEIASNSKPGDRIEIENPKTPKKKLEPRSPYGNRPSPRGNINSEEGEDNSIVRTAALVNIARAGPPPQFSPSDTPVSEQASRSHQAIKKKRSFKDLCKDLVSSTPGLSSDNKSRSKSGEHSSSTPPVPSIPARFRNKSDKFDDLLGGLGRLLKRQDKMNGSQADLQAASQGSATPRETSSNANVNIVPGDVEAAKAEIRQLSLNSTGNITQAVRDILAKYGLLESSQNTLPIELDDEEKMGNRLPPLVYNTNLDTQDEQSCINCHKKASKDEMKVRNILTRCIECRNAYYCAIGKTCYRVHARACPVIQRPHLSFRTHSKYLPEKLREKVEYKHWQKGRYCNIADRLEEYDAVFRGEIAEGLGGLIKDLGRELDWPKEKVRGGIGELERHEVDAIYERMIRRALLLPKLEPDPFDPTTKHPNHAYHRKTGMLNCIDHRGHCANCGVDCCVVRAAELELFRPDFHPQELDSMQTVHAEIVTWVRRGEPSNMMQCTECIAEGCPWKFYCPNCFGICPLGVESCGPVCGDVLCINHQSKLNEPCDWHTPEQVAAAYNFFEVSMFDEELAGKASEEEDVESPRIIEDES